MIGQLFSQTAFVDRFAKNPENAVDVIIPIIHTNELWESNLLSIYREIPVKRLLISDGGCVDDSLDILQKFPRVEVFDHKKYVSLGYCLRKLMEEVQTEHFIYLHSDVFLPEGWFATMWRSGRQYDWCESKHNNTFLLDIEADYKNYDRALSGGQIGRKAAFEKVLPLIDDDYLYRNEDIIFSELIKKFGGTYGRSDALLFHEIMHKKGSKWRRTITRLDVVVDKSPEEELREFDTQARGLIKYLPPGKHSQASVLFSIQQLVRLGKINLNQFKEWVQTTPYGQEWIVVIDEHFNQPQNASSHLWIEIHGLARTVYAVLRQTLVVFRAVFK